jgi:hypothetical protein
VPSDTTPPSIVASVDPTPNAAGWVNVPATVSFVCSDEESGLAPNACPADVVVSADGSTTVERSVVDLAGNQASASMTVKVDQVAPVVVLQGAPAAPQCVTTDAISGVATSATLATTTVPVNGVPTTTATCSGATDNAGNAAPTLQATFVAALQFTGFLAPVDNAPTVNTGSAGKSYPIKFQLRDAQNRLVTSLAAVTSTKYRAVSCQTLQGSADALETTATSSGGLRYDSAVQQFIYNWKTPSARGCYVLEVTLADGVTKAANFNLK